MNLKAFLSNFQLKVWPITALLIAKAKGKKLYSGLDSMVKADDFELFTTEFTADSEFIKVMESGEWH